MSPAVPEGAAAVLRGGACRIFMPPDFGAGECVNKGPLPGSG